MENRGPDFSITPLRILAIYQGQWGERIAEYIERNAPPDWEVHSWKAPPVLPPVIDDPEDFLPDSFPEVDLVISLGEVGGVAQLIPDIVRMAGATAVVAPIDRNESMPQGLASQLEGWLEAMDVAVVFPKPFCSLTENHYNYGRSIQSYENPEITRFAKFFGQPELDVTVDHGVISVIQVQRDSACGCANYVAENLIGTEVDDAVEKTGLLHHHFPCLASMNRDQDYNDTLMHVSGNLLRDAVKEEIEPHLSVIYLKPHGHVDEDS